MRQDLMAAVTDMMAMIEVSKLSLPNQTSRLQCLETVQTRCNKGYCVAFLSLVALIYTKFLYSEPKFLRTTC